LDYVWRANYVILLNYGSLLLLDPSPSGFMTVTHSEGESEQNEIKLSGLDASARASTGANKSNAYDRHN
jgi:hypothetical protein